MENFTEAGFTVLKHAELLKVRKRLLKTGEGSPKTASTRIRLRLETEIFLDVNSCPHLKGT